jgi:hypothetical protein
VDSIFLAFSGRNGPYENKLHSSSRDTPMSLSDNGSITVVQLMDRPGQHIFVAGVSCLALKRDSESNHPVFVSCVTSPTATRHNESDHPGGPPRLAESNQDHKLAGRVASVFGLQRRVSQSDIL